MGRRTARLVSFVLYMAGRVFTDSAGIAMGLRITLGLVGLCYDVVTFVLCCGRAGCWLACLQAWLIVGLGASWSVCGLHCKTVLDLA